MQAGRVHGSESARKKEQRKEGWPQSASGENDLGKVFFLTLNRNFQGFLKPARVEAGKAPTFFL
jgi:hypothetical protein